MLFPRFPSIYLIRVADLVGSATLFVNENELIVTSKQEAEDGSN